MAWRKNAKRAPVDSYLEPLAEAYERARADSLRATGEGLADAIRRERSAERRLSRVIEPGDGGAYYAGTGYRYSLDAAGELVRDVIRTRPVRCVTADDRKRMKRMER